MAKTTNVFARVEPELKEQAETVLDMLGIPMSNAISIFLKQVVLQRGLPFDVKLPESAPPVAMGRLTKTELDAELQKGYQDYLEGHSRPADEVFHKMEQELGL